MRLDGFDATTVPEQQEFTALPEGDYIAIITSSEEKPTKAGTGSYLQLVFEVLEGQMKGRKVWDRLNLKNPNATAVDIAQRALGAICRAVGVPRPQDSSELHNKPMRIHVAVEKDERGREGNSIKKYEAAFSGGAGGTFQQAQGAAFSQQPSSPAMAAPSQTAPAPAQSAPWAR